MFLLELSLYELKQFIQIVLWVSLPLIAVCLAVTTFLHYRRKRKRNDWEDEAIVYGLPAPAAVQPMLSAQSRVTGNEALLKQYELQLRQNREKYHTLERSFRMLQENYTAVISRFDYDDDSIDKNELQTLKERIRGYELKIAQLEQALTYIRDNSEATGISSKETYDNSKEEIERLEKLVVKLTEDLNSRIDGHNQPNGELDSAARDEQLLSLQEKIGRVEEENLALKNSFPEISCLEDLIKEKNLQIDFLQQQLEQRIKHNHHLEHRQNILNQSNEQLQVLLTASQLEADSLEQGINARQNEYDELAAKLDEALQKNGQIEQEVKQVQSEITNITNESAGWQQKNDGLNELLAEKISIIRKMEDELIVARKTAAGFEAKWENSSQLISRIYRELSGSVANQMIVSANGAIISSGSEEAHAEILP